MASKMDEQTPAGINELEQCYAEIDRLKTENELLKEINESYKKAFDYIEKQNAKLKERFKEGLNYATDKPIVHLENIIKIREKEYIKLEKIINKLKKAGLEATNLIAHLKDQHSFNDVEEETQNKLNEVFGYQGDW